MMTVCSKSSGRPRSRRRRKEGAARRRRRRRRTEAARAERRRSKKGKGEERKERGGYFWPKKRESASLAKFHCANLQSGPKISGTQSQPRMSETSKELLDQPSKPSLLEGLLLGRKDSGTKSQKKNSSREDVKKRVLTTEVPKSQVLGKIKDFLGVMAKANEELELNAQGTSRSDYDIEVLNENEREYIEMDLLLGVADLHTPDAVAAAEAAVGGLQPSVYTSGRSSSSSDTEDESDEDDDSGDENSKGSCHVEKQDSDDPRVSESKPVKKPNKRPKIVVLN